MYGRDGQLNKLNATRHDVMQPMHVRLSADKSRQKILDQMRDVKLMSMRERLMRAAVAGDRYEMAKISAQMKEYTKEDTESGHYGI